MVKPYLLFMITDNEALRKQVNDFCTCAHDEKNHCKIAAPDLINIDQCDAVLVADDKMSLVRKGDYDHISLPFIYLNEKNKDPYAKNVQKYVDEMIDMNKITVAGFFRAIKNTIEKFHINMELNKQTLTLKKISGELTENASLSRQSKNQTHHLIEENIHLIEIIQKQNETLKKFVRIDMLTKVGNRLSFEETLASMLSQAKRYKDLLAVLIIDLDKFKNINDTRGHHVGDFLLQKVAERFKSVLRKGDFVARMGGDEFAIILSKIKSVHAAGLVAWKIIQEISKPYSFEGVDMQIDVSIGIACFPLIGETSEDLIKNADMAMYQAKKSRTLRYAFANNAAHNDHVKKVNMENELKNAIDRNELTMVYQPIYEIPSQKLHGFEALIRWNSKNLGQISPSDFIPIAEDSGLIHSISTWVLNSVCKQISLWRKKNPFPYKISVNLSPSQLVESSLLESVNAAVKLYDIPLNLIEFEITEMAAMQENKESSDAIKSLCSLGATHALDDFGTGYSSIKHLRLLPITTIKIDQSFVQGIGLQKADESIVSSIISLAKKMELKVVAEGVETEQQLDFLMKEKCDYIQGYLFSKPLTIELASKLIESQKLNGDSEKQ